MGPAFGEKFRVWCKGTCYNMSPLGKERKGVCCKDEEQAAKKPPLK